MRLRPLFSFCLLLLIVSTAQAAQYYVKPGGSGSTCSLSVPCSLSTGMSNGGAGDEVILLDGTYTISGSFSPSSGTSGSRHTIRAQNIKKAIVKTTGTYLLSSSGNDYFTVRGIWFDANKGSGNYARCTNFTASNSNVDGVIVEDCTFSSCYSSGLSLITQGSNNDVNNFIFRRNTVDGTGKIANGEGGYIGFVASKGGTGTINNLQMYYNTFKNFTSDGINTKQGAHTADIHHNTFTRMQNTSCCNAETIFTTQENGTGINFHDNIAYDVNPGIGPMRVQKGGGHHVHHNVFTNVLVAGGSAIRVSGGGGNGTPTEIDHNTFCRIDTGSTDIESSGSPQPNIHDNTIDTSPGPTSWGAAFDEPCLSEINRIQAEIAGSGTPGPTPISPTVNTCAVQDATPTLVDIAYTNITTSPILPNGTVTGSSFLKAGSAWTISSSTRLNVTTHRYTMSSAATAGQSITYTYSRATGNITDSSTTPNELTETLNFPCVNNVAGGGTPTRTQSHVRFHNLNKAEGTAWVSTEDATGIVYPGGYIRARAQINVTVANAPLVAYAWYCRDNGGSYYKVDSTSVSNWVKYTDDTAIDAPASMATTRQLTSCTFGEGRFFKSGWEDSTPEGIALASGTCGEFEAAFAISASAVVGQLIDCRIEESGGTDLNTYTTLATITVSNPRSYK